ncbi:MAG: thioredoxin-dependent peroxiredoxin [Thermoanaerobacter sp.]|nr:thioredoxin-dependent peroxiredoxin [Thermoanaerobacter sp.]
MKFFKRIDIIWIKNNDYLKKIILERSTFSIDSEGIARKIFRRVKVDGHVKEVLKVLDEIEKSLGKALNFFSYILSRACLKSFIISSISSIPTETLISPSEIPNAFNSSLLRDLWDVDFG